MQIIQAIALYSDGYLCLQLSPDCRYLQTKITFEIGKEKFTCCGNRLLHPGYTSVMPWQALASDEELPTFERGQLLGINEVLLNQRVSQTFQLICVSFSNVYLFCHAFHW